MFVLYELPEPDWSSWLASRPRLIREMARAHPPNRLYRLRPTDQRVTVIGYAENGTLRVLVGEEDDGALVFGALEVFGIDPNDLEEIDPESA